MKDYERDLLQGFLVTGEKGLDNNAFSSFFEFASVMNGR